MEKEFDLSKKIQSVGNMDIWINKEDVREFIKICLDIISNPELSIIQKKAKIKEIAGEKLNK